MTNRSIRQAAAHLRNTTAATLISSLSLFSPFALADVLISEIHYDNTGTDSNEAIELAGPAGTDLTGWSLVLYNGSNGSTYNTINVDGSLEGVDVCEQGYWVTTLPVNGLQNGSPDGIALVDTLGSVIEFISYEGEFTAADGPAAGLMSTDIGVSEGSDTPLGFSLQRIDGAWQPPAEQTFGGCGTTVVDPDPVAVSVGMVQGAGSHVAIAGSVIVEATVTATYLGSTKLNGFYIQDALADSDGDPTTSDGIFVYCPSCDAVSAGDRVRVEGDAGEFFGQSQISADSVDVLGAGAVPAPVIVARPIEAQSLAEVDADYERFEGMLVTLPEPFTVTETFNLGRFGEILLSAEGRLRQFTDANMPSAEGLEIHVLDRAQRVLLLDDGSTQQNPEPTPYPVNGLTFETSPRGGDVLPVLTGVLGYGFSQWRIQPVAPLSQYAFERENPRAELTTDPTGLRIASFNVLNYFTTIDTGAPICGPLADQGCRGADSAEEFERQQTKLVAAICALDADILGLMEIENSPSALANLTEAVNAECAGYEGLDYDAVNAGTLGGDAIAVAMLFRPERVAAVGAPNVLDTPAFTNPNGSAVDKNRPALAQAFHAGAGEPFTVVVNHLKSKGSNCADGSDANDDDTQTGQGNCNGTRTQAMREQLDWLDTIATNGRVLLLGDLNAYRNEDPITLTEARGYTDLLDLWLGDDAYTFVFNGEWGYLDHALASDALLAEVVGVQTWSINADEVRLLDYNSEFKPSNYLDALYQADPWRASDHDPVIVTLAIKPPAPTLTLAGIGDDFSAAVAAGDITGWSVWPNAWLSKFNLLRYEALLHMAVRLAAAGDSRECNLVARLIALSDDAPKPLDLITGSGVGAHVEKLRAYREVACVR